MPSFLRRHLLAVLTIAALASFHIARAQDAMAPESAFRDNTAWTVEDGALTTKVAAQDRGLVTRATLADSITSFEYRAPAGARANLVLMGRYAFELVGNRKRKWQPFAVRFRAPRFDAGFTKLDNAFALDVRNGSELTRSVFFEGPSAVAIWQGEDKRGPAFIVVAEGPFSVRNARHEPADFAQLTLPKAAGGDTNEKDLRDLVALGKQTFEARGLRGLPPGGAQRHGRELGSDSVRTGARRTAHARSGRGR